MLRGIWVARVRATPAGESMVPPVFMGTSPPPPPRKLAKNCAVCGGVAVVGRRGSGGGAGEGAASAGGVATRAAAAGVERGGVGRGEAWLMCQSLSAASLYRRGDCVGASGGGVVSGKDRRATASRGAGRRRRAYRSERVGRVERGRSARAAGDARARRSRQRESIPRNRVTANIYTETRRCNIRAFRHRAAYRARGVSASALWTQGAARRAAASGDDANGPNVTAVDGARSAS